MHGRSLRADERARTVIRSSKRSRRAKRGILHRTLGSGKAATRSCMSAMCGVERFTISPTQSTLTSDAWSGASHPNLDCSNPQSRPCERPLSCKPLRSWPQQPHCQHSLAPQPRSIIRPASALQRGTSETAVGRGASESHATSSAAGMRCPVQLQAALLAPSLQRGCDVTICGRTNLFGPVASTAVVLPLRLVLRADDAGAAALPCLSR
jgi:hypothetical protein